MFPEHKPLYALTIGEYIEITKQLIEDVIKEREQKNEVNNKQEDEKAETFTIYELAKFLRCSKVSIHNYKKLGMPFYRIGRKILFKKNEVLNFMKGLRNKRVIQA
jgi:excisionase family DNA binding protein